VTGKTILIMSKNTDNGGEIARASDERAELRVRR
jgi:hypothetical protein